MISVDNSSTRSRSIKPKSGSSMASRLAFYHRLRFPWIAMRSGSFKSPTFEPCATRRILGLRSYHCGVNLRSNDKLYIPFRGSPLVHFAQRARTFAFSHCGREGWICIRSAWDIMRVEGENNEVKFSEESNLVVPAVPIGLAMRHPPRPANDPDDALPIGGGESNPTCHIRQANLVESMNVEFFVCISDTDTGSKPTHDELRKKDKMRTTESRVNARSPLKFAHLSAAQLTRESPKKNVKTFRRGESNPVAPANPREASTLRPATHHVRLFCESQIDPIRCARISDGKIEGFMSSRLSGKHRQPRTSEIQREEKQTSQKIGHGFKHSDSWNRTPICQRWCN
ncbi:hypothetical protein DFH06DRAFT_1128696 [Mycena polygramma]|nr:hypothetical protein DFH06DRAFT_1128696 [Mycena polygramma]